MNCLSLRPFLSAAILLAACSSNASTVRPARPSGAGNVITADEIAQSPGMSLEQILVARIPGLTFGRSDDGRTIVRLRGGSTTIMGSEEALIVINGIALGPNAAGNLNAIDPHDIESITVLRDAASTAQWGSRGANGVILIKTKHG